MRKLLLGFVVVAGVLSVADISNAGCSGRARARLFFRARASIQNREFAPVRNFLRGVFVLRANAGC